MTQTERNEGHILCAEFLGWKNNPSVGDYWEVPLGQFFEYSAYNPNDMLFSYDWNWIRLVIEQIRKTVDKEDYDEQLAIDDRVSIFGVTIWEPLEGLFWHVTEFIKWYNTNKFKTTWKAEE